MSVTRRYYTGAHQGVVHAFLIDANAAHQSAHLANDADGASAVLRLWLEHFDQHLGGMEARKLIEYLETRQVWHLHGEWAVIKNPGEPAIAYTAQKNPNGDVTLIALGICYQYPGGENAWWRDVILPRLMRL